jgi:hypothetical protein
MQATTLETNGYQRDSEAMDWIRLPQNRVEWRLYVNAVMNHLIP